MWFFLHVNTFTKTKTARSLELSYWQEYSGPFPQPLSLPVHGFGELLHRAQVFVFDSFQAIQLGAKETLNKKASKFTRCQGSPVQACYRKHKEPHYTLNTAMSAHLQGA